MIDSLIIEKIVPYIGGIKNISRTERNNEEIIFVLKDRSLISPEIENQFYQEMILSITKNYVKIKKYECEEKKMKKDTIDYNNLADVIIENVGGKNNIASLRHCYTRLRFSLKDDQKANTKVLETTDGVLGVVNNKDEYMVIIGNNVAKAYNAIIKKINLSEETITLLKHSILDYALFFNGLRSNSY